MGFLVLRREPGYILELQPGSPFETGVCSAKSGQLSRPDGHHRNSNYALQDYKNASGSQAGDQASVCSWHRVIRIPINFQEASGIVTF